MLLGKGINKGEKGMFTHRFDGVLKMERVDGMLRATHVQTIPMPPVGTMCTFTGGGLGMRPMRPDEKIKPVVVSSGNLRGALHGRPIKSGGYFEYMGKKDGQHFFKEKGEKK